MISFIVLRFVIPELHFTNEPLFEYKVDCDVLKSVKFVNVFDIDNFKVFNPLEALISWIKIIYILRDNSASNKILDFFKAQNETSVLCYFIKPKGYRWISKYYWCEEDANIWAEEVLVKDVCVHQD
jgi:hypothetical protein